MYKNLIIFFIIGVLFLLALTVVVYKTKIVHNTRDSSGQLKKKQSFAGAMIMLIVFGLMVSFFSIFQIMTYNTESSFIEMILGTSTLMLLLVAFDSIFIDIILIGKIRPIFLRIPSETTMESMKIHVIKTFTIGWVFILPIILISSALSFWIIG